MTSVASASEPLRVLYLIDSLRAGGKERQSVQLLVGLGARADVRVQLVWLDGDAFFAEALNGTAAKCTPVPRRRRWDWSVFTRLRKLCREFRPQIIHTTCWMTSFYGWPLARVTGAKLVNGSIRNAFQGHGFRWRAEKLLLQMSDAVIANSAAGLASRGFRADPRKRRYVVWNGFDFARLTGGGENPAAIELQRVAAGRKIVGMVAQFKDDKDYATFCQAARLVPEALFVTIGDGKNFESLREEHGLPKGPVLFLGRQNNVESLVRVFDVGVLATFVEGFPNAVLEYMALGKPVVVTDGGGTAEVVVDGATGFLVAAKDPAVLADRIQNLLSQPELAAAMGRRGRERVEQMFSIAALVNNTLRVYQEAVLRSRIE